MVCGLIPIKFRMQLGVTLSQFSQFRVPRAEKAERKNAQNAFADENRTARCEMPEHRKSCHPALHTFSQKAKPEFSGIVYPASLHQSKAENVESPATFLLRSSSFKLAFLPLWARGGLGRQKRDKASRGPPVWPPGKI